MQATEEENINHKKVIELIQAQDSLIKNLEEKNTYNVEEIKRLNEFIRLLGKRYYAPSSEKNSSSQLWLDGFEPKLNADNNPGAIEVGPYSRKKTSQEEKGSGGRKGIPASLPRIRRIIDLADNDKICPQDGSILKLMGEEISERLEYVPANFNVIQFVRLKYSCPCCHSYIATAPVEPSVIPKSIATPSLLAQIIVAKYCDALPLFRICVIFKRSGIEIARQTMSLWMISVSQQVKPLINIMRDDLLEGDYLGMDETFLQVLKEEGKKATTKSYLWVQVRMVGIQIVIFSYSPNRTAATALELLEGFSGYLSVDGYAGYDAAFKLPGRIRVGCLDHVRRYFVDAWKAAGKKGTSITALNLIGQIYLLERNMAEDTPEVRLKKRQEYSKPIYETLNAHCLDLKSKVPAKSLIAKAVGYTLNEWPNIIVPLKDGRLRVSNIIVENKVRPIAIGRKNFLFADTVAGAIASADLYSLIETAKMNGKNPSEYLINLFEKLPYAKTLGDFLKLLPYDPLGATVISSPRAIEDENKIFH